MHAIVPFEVGTDTLVSLDLTATNTQLTHALVTDMEAFSDYINTTIKNAGARYAIGGYDEHRTVYSRSSVFDAQTGTEEPRRLHLGVDIWAEAGTPVFAPLEGVVHSFDFRETYGDYGAVIILQHEWEGKIIHGLYGHLSLQSLQSLQPGMHIASGQNFAWFGEPSENGHWPPHLHFQLIRDMGDHIGDYPGVCRYSERASYLANCPDPMLWLGQTFGL